MIGLLLSMALASADCTVIAGARVHTADGPQRGTTVVLVDDRIAAVSKAPTGLKLTLDSRQEVSGASWEGADCTFVQGADHELTTGLIVGPTQLGLVEVGLEPGTRRDNPETDDPIRAALVATDAVDPLSSLFGVARVEGVTGAIVAPGGGWISGQAGFVRLHGATQAEAVVQPSVAMIAGLPSRSTADALRQWRELADHVAAWRRSEASYDQRRPYLDGLSRRDLRALVPVFAGQQPVVVQADAAHVLEAVLRLRAELGLRMVIEGAAEGWMVAEDLAAAGVAVVIDPTVYGAGGFDQLHGRPDNAALLAEAGVPIMFQNGRYNVHNVRTVRQWAGNAVRDGLDHATAVRGLTQVPADVYGLDGYGRIEPGAAADVVLWTGDPLELSSWPARVWIGGVSIENRSRQTELRDRYRTLPGTPGPLTLPEP